MPGILELIRERASVRGPFDAQRPISEEDLAAILEAARWSPTAHNMQNFEIVVVDDPATLDAIANIKRPISEAFIRENYEQLSFSEEELMRRKTGLLATQFPPAWRNPDFHADTLTAEETAAMQRPMPTAPLLLVVVYDPSKRAPASEGDFLGIVSLGCVMENMWLTAEALGISLQIVSSLSNDREVRRILGIPDELEVAFSCRLGYPIAPAPKRLRVRRDVADFASRNRFGG
ncbi:MAG: nitroreductase family protein [Coriobacteriia bacterium]|nr:nitroreductase family protein [Coriobacteriia bacterium]